jgi:hypothetical protein
MAYNTAFPYDPKQRRRLFTSEEDALLCRIMFERTFSTWIEVAAYLPGRSARQCRDRWANYLCPYNKNAPWTEEEDALLMAKVEELGCRWTTISKSFDGRSENNVKNRWYTHLKPKVEAAATVHEKDVMPPKRVPFPSIESLTPSLMIRSLIDEDAAIPVAIHQTNPCFI